MFHFFAIFRMTYSARLAYVFQMTLSSMAHTLFLDENVISYTYPETQVPDEFNSVLQSSDDG